DSNWQDHLLVEVTDRADAQFEAKMIQELTDLTPGWTIDQDYLTDMREDQMLFILIPLLLFGIIGGFLIFNVALGLFGVLWQNINKRKEEIGVRRAIGSPKGAITGQFMGEMLVLATLSMLVGLVFAVQFPLLQVFELASDVYLWGMLIAVIAMYVLVGICSLFPSWQAAQLAPALALKEE
ncbi:MAG: ABC transporter permease, partial [Bacteroidota bacterium]